MEGLNFITSELHKNFTPCSSYLDTKLGSVADASAFTVTNGHAS